MASITCGVQAFPQVSLAGSAGRALNSKNVIMLSAMSIKTIATSRRTMYAPTVHLPDGHPDGSGCVTSVRRSAPARDAGTDRVVRVVRVRYAGSAGSAGTGSAIEGYGTT